MCLSIDGRELFLGEEWLLWGSKLFMQLLAVCAFGVGGECLRAEARVVLSTKLSYLFVVHEGCFEVASIMYNGISMECLSEVVNYMISTVYAVLGFAWHYLIPQSRMPRPNQDVLRTSSSVKSSHFLAFSGWLFFHLAIERRRSMRLAELRMYFQIGGQDRTRRIALPRHLNPETEASFRN